MRILVLGINYWPEKTGIAPVMTQRCEFLAARGHDVQVCTGLPYYPDWKIDAAYKGKAWTREKVNGVNILRSWLWVPERVTSRKRILHEASFIAASLIRAFSAHKPELLIVESPPLGLACVAVLLSWFWRIPYIFDVMDLQPDAAAELGLLKPGKLLDLLYRTEFMAYRHAKRVTTLTPEMAQRIIDKHIPASKVMVCPIPATQAAFDVVTLADGASFRAQHGLAEKFIVLHSGNMGVKQGLDVVLRAAAKLSTENIEFLLVGSGADRPRLESLAAAMSLSNVRFLPVLGDAEFAACLAAADVALVTQQKSVSDIVFPSKTVTYLASGKPVLASVNSDSRVAQTIREAGAGEVVAAEDAEALADRLLAAKANRSRLQEWSDAGHAYAMSKWHPANVLAHYERVLLDCVRPRGNALVAESSDDASVQRNSSPDNAFQ
jgi:colanic acid biosynthesis glycosyl transferase WcaI